MEKIYMKKNLKLFKKTQTNHNDLSSYKDLLEILNQLSKEDLDQTITLYMENMDEYFPVVIEIHTIESTDILDDNHKVIILKSPEGETNAD